MWLVEESLISRGRYVGLPRTILLLFKRFTNCWASFNSVDVRSFYSSFSLTSWFFISLSCIFHPCYFGPAFSAPPYTYWARRPVSSTSAMTSKVKGQGRKITLSLWQMLTHKSRTKSPRNNKIGTKVAHPMETIRRLVWRSKGQRSRSPGRLMLRSKVCHIFRTGRPTYRCRWPYHRLEAWPPRSKIKVARSRGPTDSCWPISRERKVPATPKLVRRLPTPRTITRTRFELRRSKVKVTRVINAETESASAQSGDMVVPRTVGGASTLQHHSSGMPFL